MRASGALALALLAVSLGAAPPSRLGGVRIDMRGARYCEIFVVRRRLSAPQAEVYNTLGLNDCPDPVWKPIDAGALKKQLGATAVIKNGPRYFLMDSSSYEIPGREVTLSGLSLRLVAHIALPRGALLPWKKRRPYTETTIRRETRWVYRAGRPVYELESPGGRSYAMQSYALIVDPDQTPASLGSLGSRLRLPPGWVYRRVVPQTDLTLSTVDGTAHVIQDDFENTYQRIK